MPEEPSGISNAKVLKVYYEDRGWYEYRRPVANVEGRKNPEELMPHVRDSPWKALCWTPQHRTFVSAWMMSDNCSLRPLPNKVTSWIRGKPVASLTTVKPYMGRTPECAQLQERRIDEDNDACATQLWVNSRRTSTDTTKSLNTDTKKHATGMNGLMGAFHFRMRRFKSCIRSEASKSILSCRLRLPCSRP